MIKRKQGFTLIEMLVVIYVVSILSAITIPNMSRWYATIKINNTNRNLISDLRLAQQNAVTTQINYSIKIDKAANEYYLIKKGTPDQTIKTIILPSRINFNTVIIDPDSAEIVFNSAGAPSSAGTITLINNYAVIKSVTVTPSGFIKEI